MLAIIIFVFNALEISTQSVSQLPSNHSSLNTESSTKTQYCVDYYIPSVVTLTVKLLTANQSQCCESLSVGPHTFVMNKSQAEIVNHSNLQNIPEVLFHVLNNIPDIRKGRANKTGRRVTGRMATVRSDEIDFYSAPDGTVKVRVGQERFSIPDELNALVDFVSPSKLQNIVDRLVLLGINVHMKNGRVLLKEPSKQDLVKIQVTGSRSNQSVDVFVNNEKFSLPSDVSRLAASIQSSSNITDIVQRSLIKYGFDRERDLLKNELIIKNKKLGIPNSFEFGKIIEENFREKNHSIRLRISTVGGKAQKVAVRIDDLEYNLPEDQAVFNIFLHRYPALTYEIIKALTEQNIPVEFNDETGEVSVRFSESLPIPHTIQSVSVTIDGENYTIPNEWNRIAEAVNNRKVSRPDLLVELLDVHNIPIPESVLQTIKAHIHLKISISGLQFVLPQDLRRLWATVNSAQAIVELRDSLIKAGVMNSIVGSDLHLSRPFNLAIPPIPLTIQNLNNMHLFKPDITIENNRVSIHTKNGSFALPGDEQKLEAAFRNGLSISAFVDALREKGIAVSIGSNRQLLLYVNKFQIFLKMPNTSRVSYRLRMKVTTRDGKSDYQLILADGGLLALPDQWNELQQAVNEKRIRIPSLLKLFGKGTVNIPFQVLADGSVRVRLNNEIYLLRENGIQD